MNEPKATQRVGVDALGASIQMMPLPTFACTASGEPLVYNESAARWCESGTWEALFVRFDIGQELGPLGQDGQTRIILEPETLDQPICLDIRAAQIDDATLYVVVAHDTGGWLERYQQVCLEREELEKLVARRSRALLEARVAAEHASKIKATFMANMSHELRTPLNAIIGYSELILEDEEEQPDSMLYQDMTRILNSARHLMELINDVLDITRIEAGQISLLPSLVNLSTILDDTIRVAGALASRQRNRLYVDVPADIGLMYVDGQRVQQVLSNLLSNAAKFTENGRIELLVRELEHEDEVGVLLQVRDTGIGIDPDVVDNLFRPFVQANPSSTREYGGTGLGLAIVHEFCELMGGWVKVESTPGQGSTFSVWLPRRLEQVPVNASPALRRAGPVLVEFAERTVLIVEDDDSTREALGRALSKSGAAIEEAPNGRVAVEAMRTRRPDIVLLDLMMPELDGFQVLDEMRKDPELQDVPVVVLTAMELSQSQLKELRRWAVSRILSKGAYDRNSLIDELQLAMHSA